MVGKPVSLVNPSGIPGAARRARSGVVAADAFNPNAAADPAALGFDTRGARWIHVLIRLPDVGTSLNWQFWLWSHDAQLWGLDTRLGTGGTVPLAFADADNPQPNIIEIGAVPRVYVLFRDLVGFVPASTGVDLWVAGSGKVETPTGP